MARTNRIVGRIRLKQQVARAKILMKNMVTTITEVYTKGEKQGIAIGKQQVADAASHLNYTE